MTQVILERRPDGYFDALVVTQEGTVLSRDAILTWQDQMRWENTAREMRDAWEVGD